MGAKATLGVRVSDDLLDQARDAVVLVQRFEAGFTMRQLVEDGLKAQLKRITRKHGAIPARGADALRPGRRIA